MSPGPWRSRLVSRRVVAEHTIACVLERPDGFAFRSGQSVDVTLLNAPERDAEGPIRSFSIASGPQESGLLVVMRVRNSAFKQVFATMPVGTAVMLEGPNGTFVLDGADRPLVFIAGDVGVAPFLSMLRDAARTGRSLRATLFYSNRRPEDAAFLKELEAFECPLPDFHCIATMTRMGDSRTPWAGETEHVGRAMLERALGTLAGRRYYIAGSPALIAALRYELVGAGVPEADIAVEMFSGY